MRASLKLISFIFWVFSFTFAQGQECNRKDIKLENTQPLEKETFEDGDTVRISCIAGYSGLYKYKCNKGKWDPTNERKCTKIKCGHPGNTPNGDFRLLGKNTEFVFGATVQYSCKKGYNMANRVYQRTCRENGWDNIIPVCEGRWNMLATEENICKLPLDRHVYLPTYYFKEDLKLGTRRSYSCLPGYRQLADRAVCTQDGWKPDPLCSEILCEAPEIPNARIIGIQKQNYRISATVQYHCIFRPELSIQITCNPEGQWRGIQACTDGTCQEQELKNVKIIFGHPSVTVPYVTGHVLVFLCSDDNMKIYGPRAIECQSDGRWSKPFPQCRGAVQCSTPTKQLQFVTLLNEKDVYNNLDILRYKCSSPYNETSGGALMCQNGKWNETFLCTSKTCPPPPYLENGDYTIKDQTNDGITVVHYTCQSYYVLNQQQDNYKCVNGRWDTPPNCLKPCEINEAVEMYNLQPPGEKLYVKHNSKYRLNCTSGWIAGDVMRSTYVDVQCSDGNLQIDKSCDIKKS